ncbi:uncharacterized protein ACO6RY_20057 [Pungitius sinensis]
MARLWLMAALLLLSASAARSVDPKELAKLIEGLMCQYRVENMFSLALSIPNEEPYPLDQVINKNPGEEVKRQLREGKVYKGQRLVAATVESGSGQREHAEYRVLNNLHFKGTNDDLLVIYSYASPCSTKCTKINGNQIIINKINDVKRKWGEEVFVFTKIFDKDKNLNKEHNVMRALKNLRSAIGPRNIFRCDVKDGSFQCISCYDSNNQANQLNRFCYSDTEKSNNKEIVVDEDGWCEIRYKIINKSPGGSNKRGRMEDC